MSALNVSLRVRGTADLQRHKFKLALRVRGTADLQNRLSEESGNTTNGILIYFERCTHPSQHCHFCSTCTGRGLHNTLQPRISGSADLHRQGFGMVFKLAGAGGWEPPLPASSKTSPDPCGHESAVPLTCSSSGSRDPCTSESKSIYFYRKQTCKRLA